MNLLRKSHYCQIFRSFSLNRLTIRLKSSKNLTKNGFPSLRSPKSDRLLEKLNYLQSIPHDTLPAQAWRIDIADESSNTFTGDMSGEFGLLPKLARDSHVLVAHNAIPQVATGVARLLHMPPSVIGQLAKESNVKKLVLSHRMLRTLDKKSETQSNIEKFYVGELIFSNDLDCIKID